MSDVRTDDARRAPITHVDERHAAIERTSLTNVPDR